MSAISYGRVAMILRNGRDLLSRLGESPSETLQNEPPSALRRRLSGFTHRFHDGAHLAIFALFLRAARRDAGGLEAFVRRRATAAAGESDGERAVAALASAFRTFAERARRTFSPAPSSSGLRFLLPHPADGSVCKRACMFLRWVARPDDGVDLGLWKFPAPAELVVPLDTHVARAARALGLARRRSDSFATAVEVTRALSRLAPEDPLRYDFALCHLGVSLAARLRPHLEAGGASFARRLPALMREGNRLVAWKGARHKG